MSERFDLPGDWSLRKQRLSDRCEWVLQFKGMDWFRITEFTGPVPTIMESMDGDIERFAKDMNHDPIK
jgi:hypothetical protein